MQLPPRAGDRYTAPDASGWGRAEGVHFFERVCGGADPAEPLPLFVMLHGLGDRPGEDWFQDLPWPVRVVLPRAPRVVGEGFGWFETRVSDRNRDALARDIRTAAEWVARLLDTLRRRRPTRGNPIVAGFSQGALITYQVALRHPELLSLAHPLAGMLPKALWPSAAASGPQLATPIEATHGTTDDVIAIADHRALVRHLKAAGFPVVLREFEGVHHEIAGGMAESMERALLRAFRNVPP